MNIYPPTVHLNGTGGEHLLREYKLLLRSVSTSIECLQDSTCHPRDYYVQEKGGSNHVLAVHQRTEMLKKLDEVREYAEMMVLVISEQMKKRKPSS